MSACVRAQPGACASVTRTFVSVTSPLFVTVIVHVAVPPDAIVCRSGLFVIAMLGCSGAAGGGGGGGGGGGLTITAAVSVDVTSGPVGGVPVAVALFVKSAVTAAREQV